ncbi:MAG: glucose-1-phosphate adenylyltransferase [Verrucomicrobia bacterium]|nr:glucose-1-phosphate adenylyltransferase [Verrucomicrobiota bacterium]
MKSVFAVLLAGGEGTRLHPLTKHRAKPAVTFGGIYRLIDFPLSNCINSGVRKIGVLMQTKSTSLNRHLHLAWNIYRPELGEYIYSIHPTLSRDGDLFHGTADAVFQNLRVIGSDISEVLILAADHIYKMDYSAMVRHHREHGADTTVAVIKVDRSEAHQFGIVQTTPEGRIVGFREKPRLGDPAPGEPTTALASMGVYVFGRDVLLEALSPDAMAAGEVDFGKNILPKLIHDRRVMAYDFVDENKKLSVYWRDVGTIEAFYDANMDLVGVDPIFNLYDRAWPLHTHQSPEPPAKFVFADDYPGGRCGKALDSVVSPGCIVSGGVVRRCVLSPKVCVHSWAQVDDSVLMDGVEVGRHCKIRRAIIDKGVAIPPRTIIGYNEAEDRRRFTVTESGIVVIPKFSHVPSPTGIVCLTPEVPEPHRA